MESNARTDRDIGDVVQRWHENPKCSTDRADHCSAWKIRQDRREERVLLVPKPQSTRETKAEA